MQPDKKQLELLLMHFFRECSPDFPKGKIVPSESPDFILKLKSKNRIGIELTRLHPVKMLALDAYALDQQKLREQMIATIESLVERSSAQKLFVKFLFDDKNPVTEERVLSLSVQVANAIRKAIQSRNAAGFYFIILERLQLPVVLTRILIVNHPALEVSVWERANNLGVSEDVIEDIRNSILKKDNKLFLYHRQSLNLYWLIIFADRLRGSKNHNLHNRINNHIFRSHFQKVFLFDLMQSRVLQLV